MILGRSKLGEQPNKDMHHRPASHYLDGVKAALVLIDQRAVPGADPTADAWFRAKNHFSYGRLPEGPEAKCIDCSTETDFGEGSCKVLGDKCCSFANKSGTWESLAGILQARPCEMNYV